MKTTDMTVTTGSPQEQVYELGLREHLEKVSFFKAFFTWPRALKRYSDRKKEPFDELLLVCSSVSFVGGFALLGLVHSVVSLFGYELISILASPVLIFLVLVSFLTWSAGGIGFYVIRLFTASEGGEFTDLKANKLLLDYYRKESKEITKKLVGKDGKITNRLNQLSESQQDVEDLLNRTQELLKVTKLEPRKKELRVYIGKLTHWSEIFSKAKEVIIAKRAEAIDRLSKHKKELDRRAILLNKDEEYIAVREDFKKLGGQVSGLVKESMEDVRSVFFTLQDHLEGVQSFLSSADDKNDLLIKEIDVSQISKLEERACYAEAVVELMQEDSEFVLPEDKVRVHC